MKLRTRPDHPARLTAFASALLLAGLVGCGGATPAVAPADLGTDGIVIVTNSRANVPMPRLSPITGELIGGALEQRLPVVVIAADGTPERVELAIPTLDCNNANACRSQLDAALQRVAMAVTAKPNADGANAYGAIAVARDAAQARRLQSPTIVCLQCGLDTAGALDMTGEGALRAASEDFRAYLTRTGQLVTFDGFSKVQVILTSTGATAPPQAPLAPRDKEHLTTIWTDVLTSGGATVTVDPNPAGGEPVETEYTVPTVEVPAVPVMPTTPVCAPETIAFDGASDARFEPETDHWVDVAAAREALRPLAEWIQASPTRTASVSGTTADTLSGDPEEGKKLSKKRAKAAAELLKELGVPAAQIVKVKGLGPHYPGRVNDRDAEGVPIPHLRTKNRKVIVEIVESC